MENKIETIFKFEFDEESKEHIKGVSLWAMINAVLSFVSLGITTMEFIKAYSSPFTTSFQIWSTGSEFGYFINLVLTLLLNVFLYNSGMQLKKGLDETNPVMLTKGLSNLRTYYKVYGIILIVAVVLLILFMLFVISFGAR